MRNIAVQIRRRLRPCGWQCAMGLTLLGAPACGFAQGWSLPEQPAAYMAPAGQAPWGTVAPVDFQVVEAQQIELTDPASAMPFQMPSQPELVIPGQPLDQSAVATELPKPADYYPYNYGPYSYYVPEVPYSEYCRLTRIYRSWFLGRMWTRAEMLGWETDGVDYPALVTSAPLGSGGVLGEPGTVVEFAGRELHDGMRPGGRLTIGFWFDPNQWGGIQGTYFGVDGKEVGSRFVGDIDEIFARPFLDVTTGLEGALLSLSPGVLEGSIAVEADSDLQGAEAVVRRALLTGSDSRLDFVGGYRFGRLYDNLQIGESLESLDASSGFAVGTDIERNDLFNTTNKFHGGVTGLIYHRKVNRWSLELAG